MLGVACLAVFIGVEIQFITEFWFQEPVADLNKAKLNSPRTSFLAGKWLEAAGD